MLFTDGDEVVSIDEVFEFMIFFVDHIEIWGEAGELDLIPFEMLM